MAFDAGSVIAKIKADITEFKKGLNEAKDQAATMAQKVKGSIDTMNKGIEKMAPSLQKASVAIGAAGAAGVLILKDWTDAARGSEVAVAQFNATMERAGDASGEASKKILEAANAAVQLGFDDEDAANVMADFYQRTKDVTQATELNNLSMDLARKKKIDLASAANLVNQVLSGNGKVLKQYGIDIKESATPLEALAQLQEVVGGQAQAFLTTSEGKLAAFNMRLGNIKETLGGALLPVLDQVVVIGNKVLAWFESLSPQTQAFIAKATALATILALVVAPMLLLVTMIPAIVAGFGLMVAGILALFSPITVVIGLFIGLAAILIKYRDEFAAFFQILGDNISAFLSYIVELWNADFLNIQTIITGTFETIVAFLTVIFDTIKMMFQFWLAVLTGDWKLAWDVIKNWAIAAFDTIKQLAVAFWQTLKAEFDLGASLINKAWSASMEGMKAVAASVWEGVKQVFVGGINYIINKMNKFIDGLRSATGMISKAVGIKNWNVPSIPTLAQGGIVKAQAGGILANIGEGKYDEAVIPLDGKQGMMGTHFHFHDSIISSKDAAMEIMDAAMRGMRPNLGI